MLGGVCVGNSEMRDESHYHIVGKYPGVYIESQGIHRKWSLAPFSHRTLATTGTVQDRYRV